MNRIALVLLLLASFPVSAKQLSCSIQPSKDTPPSALPGLARISRADAQKTALARINAPSKQEAAEQAKDKASSKSVQ